MHCGKFCFLSVTKTLPHYYTPSKPTHLHTILFVPALFLLPHFSFSFIIIDSLTLVLLSLPGLLSTGTKTKIWRA